MICRRKPANRAVCSGLDALRSRKRLAPSIKSRDGRLTGQVASLTVKRPVWQGCRGTLDDLAGRMFVAVVQASELAEPPSTIIGIDAELTGELVPVAPDLLTRRSSRRYRRQPCADGPKEYLAISHRPPNRIGHSS